MDVREVLSYPFDADLILQKKKRLKKELLESKNNFLHKKIAILGGSTTHIIKEILMIFLLNHGIKSSFYESEYAQYWEDAIFENETLEAFKPDIIYIHTSNRNISEYPVITDEMDVIERKICTQFNKFQAMWKKIDDKYHCPIIQNNFEYPFYRLLGNKDASDKHGRVNFITRLNLMFYDYAQTNSSFYINDINYLSADYGLEQWADPYYWYMYKYALNLSAIPNLAFNISNIIKSLFGMNKKALSLDLDDTLWGGIVGEVGIEGIEIGNETPVGEAYLEFQQYIKSHKNLGIALNVTSKNEMKNALSGLNHPYGALDENDFVVIKADWNPKSNNLAQIANDLTLLPESFVFVDDNPAEREIINQQFPNTPTPKLINIESYIKTIDRSAFFEVTNLSEGDFNRTEMYKTNKQRNESQIAFNNYEDYLLSLEMQAEIKPIDKMSILRITQLINKSNQFNLTTLRYTQAEVASLVDDINYIALYGRLLDKFGDNGIVAVTIGERKSSELHIILWLMSCRVIKRDMEYAMMDELIKRCLTSGISKIIGYYKPSGKNNMVKDFYANQGFDKVSDDKSGTVWELVLNEHYKNRNNAIKVIGG